MKLSAIEVLWITSLGIALLLTTAALMEARRDWDALRKYNGSARGVVARATIRREAFRLATQVALLVVAIPSVFSDRDVDLSVPFIALLLVPELVLLNTISDRMMRNRLAHKLEADIVSERDASLARLEAQGGRMEAKLEEASRQRGRLIEQGELAVDTIEATATEVHELHEGTAPEART